MFAASLRKRSAFSLIELVIVVLIIGIIAAIAIHKMSLGATGASDSSLTANLKVLRSAIDIYTTEHGGNPPSEADIVNQLTQFTDDAGNPVATKDATHIFGPYLRSVPALTVGAKKGGTLIANADGTNVGWIFVAGVIKSNTTATEKDARDLKYSDY